MHVAQRLKRLLDAHRRPDESRWTGQRLDLATGGVVTRSYFTNLRKGSIENPGYERMRAIAKAMGFAPEELFDETNVVGEDILDRVDKFQGQLAVECFPAQKTRTNLATAATHGGRPDDRIAIA